ncbi:uncharacterized protein LOC143257227 [Tachypleus tridentatus]|uniref:uncharacterized protein LOC143257227 n=1 Tax=Tachypleus tridentatus TaxID=6853 RepID=UPI003FD68BF0
MKLIQKSAFVTLYLSSQHLKIFLKLFSRRDNLIRLTVYYGSTERSVLSHRPKYEPIEVFSVIGGYTGFWLGVSFVAFLEWIERFLSRVSRRFRLKKRTSELTKLSVFPWKKQSRGVVSPRFSDRSIERGMQKQLPFKFNRNVWFD